MKRLLRYLATAILIVVDLCLVGYLLRRPLLEGWLRETLATELSAALGAKVEVGAIGGNWLNDLKIEGVQLRGEAGSLVVNAENLDLEVRLSPWALLHGDLSGLRSAKVTARRLVVDPTGTLPTTDAAPAEEAAPFDFAIVDRMLAQGAEIRVDELIYGTGESRRSGTLRAFLEPGSGRRGLHIDHAGTSADITAVFRPGRPPRLEGRVHTDEPTAVMAALGLVDLTDRVAGGHVTIDVHLEQDPLRLTGQVELEALHGPSQLLHRTIAAVTMTESTLEVEGASVELPGLRIASDAMVLPSPLGSVPIELGDAIGQVDVRIDDLEPYREWLPNEVRQLLPVYGRIQGWLDRGLLHVGECQLQAPGVEIQVARGRLPIEDVAQRAARDLSLDFTVEIPETRTFVIAGTSLRTTGRIDGTWAGSLVAPQVGAKLALGPTAYGRLAAGRLDAMASFDGKTLKLWQLDALGLNPGDEASTSRVAGQVDIELPANGEPLRIAADVNGELHPGWLTFAGVDPEVSSHLKPFLFDCDGSIALPSDGPPTARGQLQLSGIVVDDLPAAEFETEVVLDTTALRIDRFRLTNPTTLSLSGSFPIVEGGALDLKLDAEDQDLAFLTSLLGAAQLQGRLSVQATASGSLTAPVLAVYATGAVDGIERLLGPWPAGALGPPPSGPWQLRLRAQHDAAGIGIEELELASSPADSPAARLSSRGRVPLRWGADRGLEALPPDSDPLTADLVVGGTGPDGMDLPWSATAELRIDDGLQCRRLDAKFGPGSATGSGSLALTWDDLLAGALSDAQVRGDWKFDGLRLESIPPLLLGEIVAEGSVTGRLSVEGTISRPQPRLELALDNAQIRVPGAPRIRDLSGQIEATPQRIALLGFRAKSGAGPIALEASLEGDDLLADAASAKLTARLTGKQTLLMNSTQAKVRGDMDLTVTGTLERSLVEGKIDVTTCRVAQRVTALPGLDTLRGRGGASTNEGIMLRLLEPALGERIDLDVAIRAVRDIQIRTHTLDTDVRADLQLRGTAALARFNGTIAGSNGTVRLPGTNLAIRSLLVAFQEDDPFHPDVQLVAEGRRHGYRVQLTVSGRFDDPEVVLTSSPALPSEDLIVLVSTGQLPDRLRSQGTRGQASLVGAYLAQELAAWYLGGDTTEEESETFFDRFSVETGREISDDGLESILVEFRLSEFLSLQAERDVYEDYNGGIVFRLRFR